MHFSGHRSTRYDPGDKYVRIGVETEELPMERIQILVTFMASHLVHYTFMTVRVRIVLVHTYYMAGFNLIDRSILLVFIQT